MPESLIWFRTRVLPLLLEEDEESILFWLGIELAKKERLSDFISLRSYFEMNGLGSLRITDRAKGRIILDLEKSPLCMTEERPVLPLSLEIGLITYTMESLFQEKVEGGAEWVKSPDGSSVARFTFSF